MAQTFPTLYLMPLPVHEDYADLLGRLPYHLVERSPLDRDEAAGGVILYDLVHGALAELALLCLGYTLPVVALVTPGDEDQALRAGVQEVLPVDSLTYAMLERTLRYTFEREALIRQSEALSLAYQRAEIRLNNLIDKNRDGIVVVDKAGVVCYVNAAAADLFGRSQEQMLGSDLGLTLVSGQVTEMEILREFGEISTVELHVTETEWDNHPAQLLSLRDVTARRSAENEQREWEKLLVALEKEKEMSRVKTGFMTTVIHEFRTPLSIIQAASDLLDKYFNQLTEEKRHLRLETIKTQVRLLDSLLGEISLTVHAELGKLAFEPTPLNLEQFCRRFVDDMRQTIGANHSLNFNLDERYSYDIMGDPKLLMHIVNNLLSNAIKYSGAGTSIEFTLTQDRGDVVITVADHGIGIPVVDQLHLFESFRRGSNVGDVGGTGLGLKVVKDCVTVHQGSLAIESTEGVGTTCTVRLPYIPAA